MYESRFVFICTVYCVLYLYVCFINMCIYIYIYNQIYPFKYQMRRIARFSCQSPAFKREYSCCFLFSTSICSVTRLSRRRFSSSLACLWISSTWECFSQTVVTHPMCKRPFLPGFLLQLLWLLQTCLPWQRNDKSPVSSPALSGTTVFCQVDTPWPGPIAFESLPTPAGALPFAPGAKCMTIWYRTEICTP